MTRPQLEHIIRAAAANADVRDIVVIGSQSVLGSTPNPPIELTVSMEADVFPLDASDRSILIDGAIGELSLFHETFGYYAHGVDEMTAVLPDGWRDRLVRVETAGTMGRCRLVPGTERSRGQQVGGGQGEGFCVRGRDDRS